MLPNKQTTSKCHNVIKQFICSQSNTRPVNVTITILSNNLYAAKQTHDQQMTQSQYYQTIYIQPNKHPTSKCHNHNIIKQFICTQINTRPANVTIIMLSNNYTQPNKYTTNKCHNNIVIKQFIRSSTNIRPANFTITILSNSLYAAKQTHDQQMTQFQCYQTVLIAAIKYMSSKCQNHNVIKQFIYIQQTNGLQMSQ